jgi:hypothetical protein
MDDRDPEDRDTPADEDENINELDYLDTEVEDEDEINEDDIVKKKETGNVYTVKSHDPKRGQVLVKKDASPEDIEKAERGDPIGDETGDAEQKDRLRNADHEETDKALTFDKEQFAAEEELRKKGKLLGRGLGTPESRAGEAATHYALRQLKEGKSLDEIKSSLMDIANKKDTYLNEKWVEGALNATKFIANKYKDVGIAEVIWDTPSGTKMIGVKDHGTPSDMFITTKDGKKIGISLKKDGDVFLVNDGYEKALPSLLEGMSDDEKQQIVDTVGRQTYDVDRDNKIKEAMNVLDSEMAGDLEKSIKYYTSKPDEAKKVFGSKYEKYLEMLSDDTLTNKIKSGEKLKTDEIKAFARVIGRGTSIYKKNPDLYNNINLADNRLVGRLLKNFEDNPKFAVALKKSIIDKVHVKEILNLEQNPKLDEFITVYGEKPDGVELSKDSLLELFGEKTNKLYEVTEAFQKADTPEEKKKLASAMMKNVNNSIFIDFKDGARDGVIKIKHDDGKEYPIFTVASRTRGIGSAPVLEIHQTPYMANALKFKSFDIDKWNPLQRNNFLKKLRKKYEEKIKDNAGNSEGQKELQDGIRKIDAKLKKGE